MAVHGRVMFVQSAGCCDGSAPMCFPDGEFLTGAGDILVGDIDGCPMYIDARQLAAWPHRDRKYSGVACRGSSCDLGCWRLG
jgi:uncharacterized protein (DUF779 family)